MKQLTLDHFTVFTKVCYFATQKSSTVVTEKGYFKKFHQIIFTLAFQNNNNFYTKYIHIKMCPLHTVCTAVHILLSYLLYFYSPDDRIPVGKDIVCQRPEWPIRYGCHWHRQHADAARSQQQNVGEGARHRGPHDDAWIQGTVYLCTGCQHFHFVFCIR